MKNNEGKKQNQIILSGKKMATILLVMILCVSNIFIVRVKAQENAKEAIINFTNKYFAKRMDMLSKLQMDDSIKNYLLNDNDYYELDTLIKYRKLQIGDLRFKKIDQKVEINNIDIDNNKANVEVLLEEKISFNDTPDIVSEEVTEHDLTLIYINSEWKIQDDDFNSDFKELFAEQSSNTVKKVRSVNNNKLESVQEQILKETQEKVLNEKNELEKIKSENDSGEENEENVKQVQTRAAQFKFKKYDREAAATYARKYAKTPNKNYPFYGKPDYDDIDYADCTNFTSQCLYAGGIVADKVGEYQWYKLNSTWRGANEFYKYWNNNKGSGSTKGLKASKSNFKDIRLGDLIEKKPNKVVRHTVIVTGYKVDSWGYKDPWKYKYDVLICQHSNNRKSDMLKDYPLSAKNWTSKETIYVKISGSYK